MIVCLVSQKHLAKPSSDTRESRDRSWTELLGVLDRHVLTSDQISLFYVLDPFVSSPHFWFCVIINLERLNLVLRQDQRRDRQSWPTCRSSGAEAVSWDLTTFCMDWGLGQGKTKESRGPRSGNADTVILRENVWNIHISVILAQVYCAQPWKPQSDSHEEKVLIGEVQQGPIGSLRRGALADVSDPGGSAMSPLPCGTRCGSWESPKQQWNLALSRVFVAEP